jgi:hypothetical protein
LLTYVEQTGGYVYDIEYSEKHIRDADATLRDVPENICHFFVWHDSLQLKDAGESQSAHKQACELVFVGVKPSSESHGQDYGTEVNEHSSSK